LPELSANWNSKVKRKPEIFRFMVVLSIFFLSAFFLGCFNYPYRVEVDPLFPTQCFENPDRENPFTDYYSRLECPGINVLSISFLLETHRFKELSHPLSQILHGGQNILIYRC